jgi:TIR domain
MADQKRVFISYSHDSDAHKQWVHGLASFLVEHGIEVILDQWDLRYGDDLPTFMEKAVRDTDRVLVICTDNYIQKANSGAGGVGYEKTIVTAQILADHKNRRKFVPIVRDVTDDEKMPTFFGGAYYLDLSEGNDSEDLRLELVKQLYDVAPSRPALGSSPFLPQSVPEKPEQGVKKEPERPSLRGRDREVVFSERFAQAFPGVRGVAWFDDSETIAQHLGILLQEPLSFKEGRLAGWWRGPQNLHIERFEHIEASHFLMDHEELNIRRIAAVNQGAYYRKFVYAETAADQPTGLYPADPDVIASRVADFGYADEEYGLVDDKLPVSRAEYDDGAAIIDGRPVDIRGRVALRARYISPYNFLIAPYMSPINNKDFDYALRSYLNRLLQGEDVFEEMCAAILRLPKRE